MALTALMKAQPLADTSPFMPVGQQAPGQIESAPLEFRGVTGTGTSAVFSIYNATAKQSTWAGLEEVGHEFVIRSYDEATQTITVEIGGRLLPLKLVQGQVATAAAVQQQNPSVQRRLNSPEQRRALEKFEAEVARRRAARVNALPIGLISTGPSPGL